ncbi:aminoglycoside phosphotransferase family protein [Celeribacter indicus]|uniref:Aminoglycoside phosphotransferase domain-containing protein n=1 Tax=Celeribacter indicus TaxID=1208324 RepID=A0A0B5DXC0_9RHOB|nr:phosphotransferase [Celeribacter indicus]AJE44907.1 hypothetical protein P73_0192 [Celeribacter indicus]SDW97530.1 hypothetical protein SAMN05443573_110116 [Celeribacter indicus]
MTPDRPPIDRAGLLEEFLHAGDWAGAQVTPLAGDASRRRYFRLSRSDGRGAILMDAPPEAGEDVRPFLAVGAYLQSLGLSAPRIFETDEERGFLILEDFGQTLFDRLCARTPACEPELYDAAVDVLLRLAAAPPLAHAADYTPLMTDLALSSYRWYAAPVVGHDMTEAAEAARAVLAPLIATLGPGRVTILRDYHAQNLLWLPERDGAARVGLLDFQDAMLGHPAYDLISLTTDARRDVSGTIRERCMARFTTALGLDPVEFTRAAATCSVQRNLRILMIFSRMSLHFGKPHYVDLIPRVWAHLQRDLDHPDLAPLARLVRAHLPAPDTHVLQSLKDRCGTIPTLQ